MNTVAGPTTDAPPLVLDPCTLGRPVHLLPRVAALLREDLAALFERLLKRRYGAEFEVGELRLRPAREGDAQRWRVHGAPEGRIGCAIERSLVLAVLAHRYGLPALAAGEQEERETASEERLTANLALQLVGLVADRIDAARGGALEEQAPQRFAPTEDSVPLEGAWIAEACIAEPARGVRGMLRFLLDAAWMARLLRELAPRRSHAQDRWLAAQPPLAARLQLRLVARLLQREMPLGELLELRVGDVIPVSLGATEVLIDDSRLFNAAVAEHKGKLCLTSFADAE